jgi:hypothetical protein
MVGRLGLAAVVAASVWALPAATAAQASTVTVGSVLPVTFTPSTFGQVATRFNTALPEKGANLVSPVNGAIVRWRIQGASGGPYYLRVLHPTGNGAYTAVGTSPAATPSGTGLQTFAANMPIHAGDLVGVDPTNASDGIGVATVPGAGFASISPPPFDGATVAPNGPSAAGEEIELNAEVQPTPEITSIVPSSGSIAGGGSVTIKGSDFTNAAAVKFGTTPATTFTLDSESQITATAPAAIAPGSVDVSVTTVAGASPAVKADRFTYTACVVPKLNGKKLKPVKTKLKQAGCRLGSVTKKKGVTSKSGKVVKQTPTAGKVLTPGSKVSVRLG